MLLVVFGAGASFDSAPAYRLVYPGGGSQNFGVPSQPFDDGEPWRPPLAKNLFGDPKHAFGHIVQRYAKQSHILPYLREPSNGRSVEEELEFLQAHGHAERVCQFASVRYYLRDLFFEISDRWRDRTSGVTNYPTLIDEILRLDKSADPICLVTFNYDLLLDRALLSFAYDPQDLEDEFLAHPRLRLFKPHGSVDWARFVKQDHDTRLQPQHLIDRAETIQLTDEFIRVSSINEANSFPQGRTVFPVIAIPFQNKSQDTFAWPQSHRTQLLELLPSVTKILIIGWQAREAHFLELLRANLRGVTQHKPQARVGDHQDQIVLEAAASPELPFVSETAQYMLILPTAETVCVCDSSICTWRCRPPLESNGANWSRRLPAHHP